MNSTSWTLDGLKWAASKMTFTFFTTQHPGIRVQGVQFSNVPGLSPQEMQHLRGQVVEFRDATTMTHDPVVAWALLHAPDWLAVVPGDWSREPAEPTSASSAEPPAPKRSKKR
jgi:hypothetical protein